ncbi:MAG: S8 family serine peptidase [Pseudomonadota bacterium]
MKKYLLSAGILALSVSAASASDRGFSAQSLHLDALSNVSTQSLHLDALGMSERSLHLDALSVVPQSLHLDALSLHLDALGSSFDADSLHLDALDVAPSSLHLDALSLHLDALGSRFGGRSLHLDALGMNARSLHLDALSFDPSSLHLDALSLHLDALSGNQTMLAGDTNLFWGSFQPQSLHLDALGLTPSSLHLDALSLHLDALAGFDPQSLHLDALSLHLDALSAFDPNSLHLDALSLHLDALAAFDPSSLHLDALSLHLDALANFDPSSLHLDALSLHLDALAAFDPSSLHLDALGTLTTNSLHLDALSLHLDALASFDPESLHLDALSLHLDALENFDPDSLHLDALSLHLDALGSLDPNSLHLDALSLHLDALAAFGASSLHLDALSLHLDALSTMNADSLHLDALASVDPQSLHLDALGEVAPQSLHLDALSLHLDALSLHLDALDTMQELSLHLDALSLHLDALSAFEDLSLHLDALSLHLDALDMNELSLHLDALAGMSDLSLHLDALSLHLDALDMDALSLHLDALSYEQLSLHLDALSALTDMSLHLDALGQAAGALNAAYGTYSGLISGAEAAFGALVEAQTGESFDAGFLAAFFEKHGLEGNGFGDFLRMDENERNAFLIDMSDQLTTFLGIDHADHWMGTVNWSPRLAEVAGFGAGVKIGVVDQGFDGPGALRNTPDFVGPVFDGQDHGLAVSGVAAGALDSRGVMGVAPNADVVLSNPFAATGDADIYDVTTSVARVAQGGASIINLSLGESGYTFSDGWFDVFSDDAVRRATGDSLFVFAAGNDGIVQETDVNLRGLDVLDQIVIVGALGVDGQIASFSNTPGDANFVVNGEETAMMDRFLVAPGQQILVATPDGVGRRSGTSFAAPMVAGAAALLQSRWEWLANEPEATAEILFRSATDLGEEGVDEVYGWGLLNVEASQRPLDLSRLMLRSAAGDTSFIGSGFTQSLLARMDPTATVTVFETVGSTYRDFELPVGVMAAGAIDPSVGLEQDVERYFGERLGAAVGATQSVAGLGFTGTNGFTDAPAIGAVAFGSEEGGWTLSLEAREPAHGLMVPEGELNFETHGTLTAVESGMTLSFGQGDGALVFGGKSFSMTSDHDILTGGVNPLLGLASGGGYVHATLPMGERFAFSAGFTGRDDADLVADPFSGALTERVAGSEGYRASAAMASLTYGVSEGTTVNLGVTALNEVDGLFGGQSVGALSFGDTARSHSVTIGTESDFGRGISLALSGTVGRTTSDTGTANGLLAVGEDVLTTAYQAIVSKQGILKSDDRLRFSIAQPLTIEQGSLAVQSFDVVDRSTGQLGLVGDEIALNALDRRYVGEVIYGTPVVGGKGDLSLFTQVDTAPVLTPGEMAVTGGVRLNFRF